MICDVCSKIKATVHLTEVVNDQITKPNLCESCAKKKGTEMEQHFGIADLLQGLAEFGPQTPDIKPEGIKCKSCGMAYDDFKKIGRLGCGECYLAFRVNLSPLLKRIHGSNKHVGSKPLASGPKKKSAVPKATAGQKVETKSSAAVSTPSVPSLKQKLRKAIENEEYEQAATLRDQIRSLEGRVKK